MAATVIAVLGVAGPTVHDDGAEAVELAELGEVYWINPISLLPMVLLSARSMRKSPASLALLASALFAGALAGRRYRIEFERSQLAPQNLAGPAADSGTVTSAWSRGTRVVRS